MCWERQGGKNKEREKRHIWAKIEARWGQGRTVINMKKFIGIPWLEGIDGDETTTKNNGRLVWLRNVAEAGWERIKGVRGQQREGVIDENPELQALGGGQDTSLHHSHTRTHTILCQCRTPENTLDTLWSHTPQKLLFSWPKTSMPIHFSSLTDPGLTPVHTYRASRKWWYCQNFVVTMIVMRCKNCSVMVL